MDSRCLELAEQLLLIERELRLLGWWTQQAPSAEALASVEPFCVDTLDFAAWLQWVFLPRMKVILEQQHALPSSSGIRAMAEVVYREQPLQVRQLLELLGRFDRLIGRGSA